MTQEQRFLNWYKQRQDEALQHWRVEIHLDGSAMVVTQRFEPVAETASTQASMANKDGMPASRSKH
jgi:hypothetical protein